MVDGSLFHFLILYLYPFCGQCHIVFKKCYKDEADIWKWYLIALCLVNNFCWGNLIINNNCYKEILLLTKTKYWCTGHPTTVQFDCCIQVIKGSFGLQDFWRIFVGILFTKEKFLCHRLAGTKHHSYSIGIHSFVCWFHRIFGIHSKLF